MAELQDASIHLVITSPPYWQLKDYGTDNQIGFHESYEEYINNLNLVWKECHRVLHNGCRLCINIGDQFARSVYYGRYKVIPIREEIIKFCENAGFDYMGAVIWQKLTTSNTTGGGVQMGSYPYPRNGILKLDYEFILIFKKTGIAPKPTKELKSLSRMTNAEWNSFFAGHWNFPGVRQGKHIAMFPEELPRRLIKMFAFAGDTVLDPFAGSGTTCLVSKNLDRNSIGYEINADFIPIIKQKLGGSQMDLDGFEFITQTGIDNAFDQNYEQRIAQLPYIFRDPHKLDKKLDPRKLLFGSKIDKNSNQQIELFTVKEIISPELMKLTNGVIIKLLGVKTKPDLQGKAAEFLREKTKGRRVFLKFDKVKYDDKNNLLCYLYLSNKTFINAHLIKNKLATVDDSSDFKYKKKFFDLLSTTG
jgi:modification methylase